MTIREFKKYEPMNDEEVKQALEAASVQTGFALSRFGNGFKHIFSTNQFYTEAPNNQWTNGFWTGELWLAYEYTKDKKFLEAAMAHTESFRQRARNRIGTDTHDLGFLYSPSCVAAYKITGDERAKDTALMAADMLLERFHEKGQFLQAWGKLNEAGNYRLIIDCLLNLPLLYWAAEETGEEHYRQVADKHIHTALSHVIREDFSTWHTFFFDWETGAPDHGSTCQGYRDGSAWSRGQAWGVYGLAIGYRYTRRQEYIKAFEGVTAYFLSHLPEDLVPFWDLEFGDGDDQPKDSSAASIAACGMLEMAKYLDRAQAEYYQGIAKRLMKALTEKYAVKDPAVSNGLVLHSTYSNHSPFNTCNHYGVDECNLWGDYFYMEALTRLYKDWQMYW